MAGEFGAMGGTRESQRKHNIYNIEYDIFIECWIYNDCIYPLHNSDLNVFIDPVFNFFIFHNLC